MKQLRISRVVAAIVACVLALILAAPRVARADTAKTITLGADLTTEQRNKVLSFFNLSEQDLSSMNVVTVTNADERRYLEGTLPTDVIGNQTWSCSYIEPTTSGGIHVQTANLNYVTNYTLYNALQTAGVTNCNLVVTAPFVVSGTGALTGVFMALESNGVALDEQKKEAATVELVETANLEQNYGEDVAKLISEVKNAIAQETGGMSEDAIRELIRSEAAKYNINISDNDINMIVNIALRIRDLDYSPDAFSNTLEQISGVLNKLQETGQKAEGILGAIQSFFEGIANWCSSLFNGGNNVSQQAQDFFNNLNTDVFQFDKAK